MKYLKVLLLCLAVVPFSVKAETKYETKNLEETFKAESIDYDLTSYSENKDQITIYMFRGNGCAICKNFLSFLNSIVPEYGKYFKLESYEVWENKENSELMKKVAEFMDESAGGVPFIVIGDKAFPGYGDKLDGDIKQAILDLYNAKDKYDVFKEMKKAEFKEKMIIPCVIIVNIVLIAAAAYTVMYIENKKINTLNDKIVKLEKQLNEKDKANTKQENKKNTKKESKKVN